MFTLISVNHWQTNYVCGVQVLATSLCTKIFSWILVSLFVCLRGSESCKSPLILPALCKTGTVDINFGLPDINGCFNWQLLHQVIIYKLGSLAQYE